MSDPTPSQGAKGTGSALITSLALPMLNDDGHGPVWRRIEAALRAPIVSGDWQRGARLPIEAELAAHFKVNRHTLRRSLNALVRDGYLKSVQGRGTFVAVASQPKITLGLDGSTSEAIARADVSPSLFILKASTIEAGIKLGEVLDIDPQRAVLTMDLLISANEQAVALESLWLAHERFSRFPDALRSAGSVEVAMRGFGVAQLQRQQTNISVREPTEREYKLLKLRPPETLIVCEAVCLDDEAKPVLLLQTAWCAQRVELCAMHQAG
ncbi:MAG: GntR family transcriptional regulator [Devosiaceae bacterium]